MQSGADSTSGDFSVWIGTVPLYSFPTFRTFLVGKGEEGNTWYTWYTSKGEEGASFWIGNDIFVPFQCT